MIDQIALSLGQLLSMKQLPPSICNGLRRMHILNPANATYCFESLQVAIFFFFGQKGAQNLDKLWTGMEKR